MNVEDVMIRDVIYTDPDATLKEIAKLLTKNRIGSVVIMKNKKVAGLVTESDVLQAFASNKTEELETMKVSEIMSRFVVCIEPDAKIQKAIKTMSKYKIKKLPVVENGKLVGIMTSDDVAAAGQKILENINTLLSRKARD